MLVGASFERTRRNVVLAQLKREWGPRMCSWVPTDVWHRVVKVDLLVPHWHLASDEHLSHIRSLYRYRSVREFEEDLEFFLRSYVPVSLQDVIRHLDGRGQLPKRCFLATFDDGLREVYDVVTPVLRRKGVCGAFFLIASAIDNRELCYPHKKSLLLNALRGGHDVSAERHAAYILTREGIDGDDLPSRIKQIYYVRRHVLEELAPILGCDYGAYVRTKQPYVTSAQVAELMTLGFGIGAHSVDHPLYSEMTLEEQLTQTRQSLSWLSQQFRYECQAFAFPYQDAGISAEFFSRAFAGGTLKVSFGIGGLRRHWFPRNLPRFSMERTDLPAAPILARQFGRALLRRS